MPPEALAIGYHAAVMSRIALTTMFLLAAASAQQDVPALDPSAAGPAQRVWSAKMLDRQELWFRRAFKVPKAARRATLVFSCDNRCDVHLAGRKVAEGDDWEKLNVVDVTQDLQVGDNVIAIHAINEGSCAALAAWLFWEDQDGVAHEVVTDKQWKVGEEEVEGWATGAFDDRRWQQAVSEYETEFGKNVYNGTPRAVVYRMAFTWWADDIAKALEALRCARDSKEAGKALDALDRAVNEARAAVWEARAAEELAKKGARRKVPR